MSDRPEPKWVLLVAFATALGMMAVQYVSGAEWYVVAASGVAAVFTIYLGGTYFYEEVRDPGDKSL